MIVWLLVEFISSIYCQPDTTIYGILRDKTSQVLSLSKINLSNGIVTNISPNEFSSALSRTALATIDPINKIFYLQSNNILYGLDLSTGNIVANSLIITPITGYFDLMSFSYYDTCIYGITRDGSSQELYLSKVNPSTGIVTIISPNAFTEGYAGNALATIDPVNKVFYLQSSGVLYGIDLNTGVVKTNVLVSTPITGYFELMNFNCYDTCIYGITRDGSSQELYLSKANPLTGVVTNISPTAFNSGYAGSALATIDPNNGIFYLQSNSELYGIDLNTGVVAVHNTLTLPLTGFFEHMVFYPGFISIDNQVNLDPSSVTFDAGLLQVFPNPAKDIVCVEIKEVGFFKLLIYNTKGLLVSSQIHKGSLPVTIDVSAYIPGMYLIVLSGPKGRKSFKKLLVH